MGHHRLCLLFSIKVVYLSKTLDMLTISGCNLHLNLQVLRIGSCSMTSGERNF